MAKRHGVKLMEPRFDEPASQSMRYTGKRGGSKRRAGAGFTTKSYTASTRTVSEPEQARILPSGALSVRASSQQLASRIAGYSRPAGANDTVRQALMDMLSSDWTAPAQPSKVSGGVAGAPGGSSRAETAPPPGAAKQQRLPPITTPANATLISDPYSSSSGVPLGADPPHWSTRAAKAPVVAAMSTKPFATEPRHRDTRRLYALGPGDIDTQVAAIAQHIRAARPPAGGELGRSSGGMNLAPLTPKHRTGGRRTLTMPTSVSPGSDIVGPTVSPQRRPMGRPRVAETSEDRARAAVAALTNRYTMRIGSASANAQVIGRADPGWTASEIRKYSSLPGAPVAPAAPAAPVTLAAPAVPVASKSRAKGSPASSPAPDSSVPGAANASHATGDATAAVREGKPKPKSKSKAATAARRSRTVHAPDAAAAENPYTRAPTLVVGRAAEKTERFGLVEHDMHEEDGLTGWGAMED